MFNDLKPMKTKRYNIQITAMAGLLGMMAFQAAADPFNSGSDGSYGAMNITQNTVLNVPSNGVFKCSTISIACGVTLSFNPNPLNTPIYLLATNDVTIYGNIIVDGSGPNNSLAGVGGPGGYPGGMGGIAGGHTAGGDGAGPGAGKDVNGLFGAAFGYPAASNTNVYGNALLYPLVGGSGGAGRDASVNGVGGGGGGGAILIASNTKITFAQNCYPDNFGVYARGGAGAGGGGSGGAIRLIAPTVGGSGFVSTAGGAPGYPYGGDAGSQGRIRVDCTDDYSYRTLTYTGSFTRGSQMWVFQPNPTELDITSAAGQAIPVGTTNAVTVSLPFGSPTNQTVTLSAQNFTNSLVNVRIAVTPDTGSSSNYDGVITNTANPSVATFNVVIPSGTISKINAWTR